MQEKRLLVDKVGCRRVGEKLRFDHAKGTGLTTTQGLPRSTAPRRRHSYEGFSGRLPFGAVCRGCRSTRGRRSRTPGTPCRCRRASSWARPYCSCTASSVWWWHSPDSCTRRFCTDSKIHCIAANALMKLFNQQCYLWLTISYFYTSTTLDLQAEVSTCHSFVRPVPKYFENTIFWKRINRFHCILLQLVRGARASLGVRRSKIKVTQGRR